jgi:eukaryotic-like serine/threonine-protein kinase
MKLLRPIGALLVLTALLSAGCSGGSGTDTAGSPSATAPHEPNPGPSGFKLYTSDSPAFSIAYPSGWTTNSSSSQALFAVVAPVASGDSFAENVNVLRQVVPAGTTLQQYTDTSLAQGGSAVDDFTVAAKGSTTLSGLPATWVEYTATSNGQHGQFYAEWAIDGTDAWVITYTADPGDYKRLLADAKATISSFTLG